MKITLRNFIEGAGISGDDTYTGGVDRRPDVFFSCVQNEAYLNRNINASFPVRMKRKFCYDYGIGDIPLKSETLDYTFLYWGCLTKDSGLYSLPSFFRQLSKVSEANRFVIMLNSTDDAFSAEHAALIPDSVKKIIVTNCDVNHPKVQWRPLGRDNQNMSFFDIAPQHEKPELVYCNFSEVTHPARSRVMELLSEKDFVTAVRFDGYGKDSGYPRTRDRFIHELNSHKFAVCPRGRGVDTYRMWDSLHLGVIPIVVREAAFHEHLSELPILFLASVEDFGNLTQEYLEHVHAEMMDKEYEFNVLTASFWTRIFLKGFETDEHIGLHS